MKKKENKVSENPGRKGGLAVKKLIKLGKLPKNYFSMIAINGWKERKARLAREKKSGK